MSASTSLRQVVLKGGAYIFGRQMLSVVLKFIGVILITRVLGPTKYAAYVAGFSIYQYATSIGQVGVGVYLLRLEGEVAEGDFHTAYFLLAAMASVMVLAIELSRHMLADWAQVPEAANVLAIMVFALPFQLLTTPATVRLERQLDYKSVAMVEIVGQLGYYVLAVPLVSLGYGPISLAIAFFSQQAITFALTHYAAKAWIHFGFDGTVAKKILHYALTYSLANWIWQIRMLVNPLIVGPALGAQAVGLVGMAIGILEMLSIIKTIAWRLSVAVLSKVQSNTEKLRNAVTEGMELQVLAVGTILLGFAWTGDWIVPKLFGARWAPVMEIYPYIALSYFTNAMFNMHSSALSVLRRNGEVAIFHTVHVAIFALVVSLTVRHAGIIGYGYGEVAALASYVVIHHFLARAIGSPSYSLATLLWVGTAIGLFWHQLGLWAIAVPFIVLVMPVPLKRLRWFFDRMRVAG